MGTRHVTLTPLRYAGYAELRSCAGDTSSITKSASGFPGPVPGASGPSVRCVGGDQSPRVDSVFGAACTAARVDPSEPWGAAEAAPSATTDALASTPAVTAARHRDVFALAHKEEIVLLPRVRNDMPTPLSR
ncbi:hypothetical protein SAZ_01770 [Streptomyces noursei ZPM]|nr:hypothetical protein SAZ_01770 [Streptomyces noursei ZPM]EOT05491.1 hypothetical protein K530_03154 [Streptomyces noursei CCRC 11814]